MEGRVNRVIGCEPTTGVQCFTSSLWLVVWSRVIFVCRALEASWLIVLVQVGLESEGLIAALASVVFEGRVCLHVGAEVWTVSKGFATVGAGKGLLPRVWAHVTLKQPRPAEGFVAHLALVLEVVGEDVHGQRWHGYVHFTTGGTLAGHLAVQAAMRLLVSAEVGGGGVRLAALIAGVARRAGSPLLSPTVGTAASGASTTTLPISLSPRAPVRDEEGIHGVTLGQGLRFTSVEAAGGHARLGAVGVLQVRVTVLPSAAHLGVQGVWHWWSKLVLHLLLPLVYRWRDVILDVSWTRETHKHSWPRVVMSKDTVTC